MLGLDNLVGRHGGGSISGPSAAAGDQARTRRLLGEAYYLEPKSMHKNGLMAVYCSGLGRCLLTLSIWGSGYAPQEEGQESKGQGDVLQTFRLLQTFKFDSQITLA